MEKTHFGKRDAARKNKYSKFLCANHSDEPLRAGIMFGNGLHDSCVSSPLHKHGIFHIYFSGGCVVQMDGHFRLVDPCQKVNMTAKRMPETRTAILSGLFSFQNALKISVIPACTRFLSLSGSHHAFRLPPAFSEVSPHLL